MKRLGEVLALTVEQIVMCKVVAAYLAQSPAPPHLAPAASPRNKTGQLVYEETKASTHSTGPLARVPPHLGPAAPTGEGREKHSKERRVEGEKERKETPQHSQHGPLVGIPPRHQQRNAKRPAHAALLQPGFRV